MDLLIDGPDTPWRRVVDKIIRGEHPKRDYLNVAAGSELLVGMGFTAGPVVITPGKLARCRREHPEVTLSEIYRLPEYFGDPLAIFPSKRDDGSLVLLLVAEGVNGTPIIAAALPGTDAGPNVILSICGKDAGLGWVWQQIANAQTSKFRCWMRKDFAATQPQPDLVTLETSPSPSGLIPAGGAAKPRREILTLGSKVKDEGTKPND